MIRYDNDRIILSDDTSLDFVRHVLNPPSLNLQSTFNRITIFDSEDGFIADIPDLIVPAYPRNEEIFYSTDFPYHPLHMSDHEFYDAAENLPENQSELYSDEITKSLIASSCVKRNVYAKPPKYVIVVSIGDAAA